MIILRFFLPNCDMSRFCHFWICVLSDRNFHQVHTITIFQEEKHILQNGKSTKFCHIVKLEVFDAVGNENILPSDWEKEIDFAHFLEIRIFSRSFDWIATIQCHIGKDPRMIGKIVIVKKCMAFFLYGNLVWSHHQTKYLVYKKKPGTFS